MNALARPLAGRGVLVTRPVEQADGLARRIAELGGKPILFPCLEIQPPSRMHECTHVLSQLSSYQLAIFVSPTSVERAWPLIQERHGNWPHGVRTAAVGHGSARVLAGYGVEDVLVGEDGSDSEHLLALPALQTMAGQRVLIVRGEGGREMLADTLRQRGATVDYAECYRRARPNADPAPLLELWQAGALSAVTVTSREVFDNLVAQIGSAGAPWLRQTPLFAPHQRIAKVAREWGVTDAVSTEPGDNGLVAALTAWFKHD